MRVPSITDLIKVMKTKRAPPSSSRDHSHRSADKTEWVETTTIRPRERPKAGRTLKPLHTTSNYDVTDHSSRFTVADVASIDSSVHTSGGKMTTSPFEDDFSQYNPSGLLMNTRQSENWTVSGFEDSFIPTVNLSSSMVNR